MPLKHSTETFLVILLGLAILCTGFVLAFLPPLLAGAFPWTVFFVLSIAYPVILSGLFRKRRADKSFRMLHYIPAVMLVAWLIFAAIEYYDVSFSFLRLGYIWNWTLGAVIAGVSALVIYSIRVIRGYQKRVPALLGVLAAFVVLAFSGSYFGFNDTLTASINDIAPWKTGDDITGLFAQTQQNLEPSEDPAEEAWRVKLRRMERRQERLEELQNMAMNGSSVSSLSSASLAMSSASSARISSASSSSASAVEPPPALASSGPLTEVFAIASLGFYSGVLHVRARKRKNREYRR